MTTFRPTALAAMATAALMAAASTSASAAQELVTNGSLTGTIGNNGVPIGWSILEGTPDIMDALNNVGVPNQLRFGATPASASPNGGTWVGLGAYSGYNERFGQTLSGLQVGQQYTVSWQAGNFGYSYGSVNYLGTNAIKVLLDGVAVGSGADLSLGSSWQNQSLTFVATAASQQLSFSLASSQKAYMSIDGISVQTAAVPEPASMALMGLGLCGLAAVSRRRRG